ncbi:hypothetical protein JOD43_002961 [Pullulanibacillus pueri]|uniref:Transglutaminase-like domain-containing protein n=1 Tax=Pullulanibacillus pueri TaxID=1437324 RepID=A0A8J2ZWR8_9BACL|nr:transglutaminase-like domain-containing protein [Pullulanibacillus pueri]MBM7682782.1 hypothetical protein [Pullulanibacillus pueri]GGH83162.1 hypothetical protein GCM10007096_23620 [Pullulanibacillus pueri]
MQQAKSHTFSLLLYLLGFLLLWEWLRPLSVITNNGSVNYFVGFAAFSFLLTYLRLPYWLTFPVKFIAIVYALHLLFFYNTSFFSGLWVDYFFEDLRENLIFVFDGNWVGLTDLFRSFIFFILLWIISYLMRYWLLQARRIFLFFFVTIIYLTILDTFTMYHADLAIVRTMIIGLVLLGLLRVIKIQEKEKVSFKRKKLPLSWMLALVVMVALTSAVGYAAPKFGPQWPDPVPFIQKAANGYEEYGSGQKDAKTGGAVQQKIGYDSDDTHLGGGFSMDDTPIFYTSGEYTHYWRVTSKNFYTGKGWINKPEGKPQKVDLSHLSDYPILNLYESGTEVKKSTDTIEYLGRNFPQLIYGGSLTGIKALNQKNADLQLNENSGLFEPTYHGRHISLKSYTLEYQYPTFSIPKLSRVKGTANDPEVIKSTYLQLPTSLPARVRNLAQELTGNETNRYDKVQAIVNYLQGSDYTYQIDDVAKPSGNTDYVDQFLFDTKVGYCDNFSSSMVVLLRTVGIPARWVKGFTQGTYKETLSDSKYEYEVKNSDAHSWVEVYFPGSGWVPFEPTKSFDNINSFNYASDTEDSQTTSTPEKTQDQQEQQEKQQQPEKQEQKTAEAKTTTPKDFHLSLGTVWKVLALIVLLLLIASFILWRSRKKWLPGYLLRQYSGRTDDHALDQAFRKLLYLLQLYGYKKRPEQTLREYAERVDRHLGTKDMGRLVTKYEERSYYKADPHQWSDCKESWENIIKKLRG